MPFVFFKFSIGQTVRMRVGERGRFEIISCSCEEDNRVRYFCTPVDWLGSSGWFLESQLEAVEGTKAKPKRRKSRK